MTPQEEQLLVQIVVQCVRAVLQQGSEGLQVAHTSGPSEPHEAERAWVPGRVRIVDVVPTPMLAPGSQNGKVTLGANNGQQNDVRESVRRFLRNSEQLRPPATVVSNGSLPHAAPARDTPAAERSQKRQLITQADVLAALQRSQKVIVLQADAIVTPLARQVAKDKGIELR